MRAPSLSLDSQKRAAAEAAVSEVTAGMMVGLGTGSTAAFAVAALGRRVAEGLRIEAVATSARTAALAEAAGIAVRDFATVARVDLCIDGVDEIDPALCAVKGGGGAMLREKVVAESAARMVAIADAGKRVARLGARPLPLEVLPFAHGFVRGRLEALGLVPALRLDSPDAPFITDQGNLILDCRFDAIDDRARLAEGLAAIPGMLGHGLFLREIDALYCGTEAGVSKVERPPPAAPV